MRRLSLYKIIKKYKNYCHVSIFFNNRISKKIRFGYKFSQKSFKDAKKLKFLKISVRQPRLPVKRKTKYGKILEQRQKIIYILDSGRRSSFLKYITQFFQTSTASLNSFFNLSSINSIFFFYSFGFIENPAFQRFFGRYYESAFSTFKNFQAFRNKTVSFFNFQQYYWYYFLSTFKYRANKKLIFYYFSRKNFFFNIFTFAIYPYNTNGLRGNSSTAIYGNKNAFPKVFLRIF